MAEQIRNVAVRLAESSGDDAAPLHEESPSRFWLGLVALAVLALLTSAGTLTSKSPLPLDDVHFTGFGAIQAREGFARIWSSPTVSPQYLPLTYSTHWLEYSPQFRSPRREPPWLLARAVNAALHVVNVLLLWLLLRRLEVRGAWLASALFATLPVQVETVAWVSQRPVLLSSLFMLLCGHAFLRFADLVPSPDEDSPGWLRLPDNKWLLAATCLVLLVLALLSGTLALSLPLVLPLLAWWKRGELTGRVVAWSAAMAILSATWTALHWYHGLTGAELPGTHAVMTIAHALAFPWRFLGDVLIPWRAGFAESRFSGDGWLLALAVAATVIVLVATLLLRGRIGRTGFVLAAGFLLLLAPGLGWVPWAYMTLSDYAMHVGYLAAAMLATPVAWGVWKLTQAQRGGPGVAPAFAAATLVLVSLSAGMGLALASSYRDQASLVDRQARLAPGSASARLQQARLVLASEKPNLVRAEILLREALERSPKHVPALLELARVFERRKDYEQALSLLAQAGQVQPDNPEIPFRAAMIDTARGRTSVAKPALERLAQRGDLPRGLRLDVLNNLALLCQQRGELHEAEQLYLQAIELDPRFPASRINYANLLYALAVQSSQVDESRLNQAVQQLEAALDLDQRNWVVWLNAGAMAGTLRDMEKAERFLRIAVSLKPDSVEALRNLGQVLLIRGQEEREPFIRAKFLGDAVFLLRRAWELSPESLDLNRLLEQAEKLAAEGRGG